MVQGLHEGAALASRGCHAARHHCLTVSLPVAHALTLLPGLPQALLELRGRLLVEAALEEVVSLVAGHLDVLQVSRRRPRPCAALLAATGHARWWLGALHAP